MMAGFNSRERTLDDFEAIGCERSSLEASVELRVLCSIQAGLKFKKLWEGGDTTIVEFEAA